MASTYTDRDGGKLHMTRCRDGVHLVAVSVPKDAAVSVCIAIEDLESVIEDLRGWAVAESGAEH